MFLKNLFGIQRSNLEGVFIISYTASRLNNIYSRNFVRAARLRCIYYYYYYYIRRIPLHSDSFGKWRLGEVQYLTVYMILRQLENSVEIPWSRGAAAESAYNLLADSPAILYFPTEYNDENRCGCIFCAHNASRKYYYMDRGGKKMIQEAARGRSGVKSRLVYTCIHYIQNENFPVGCPCPRSVYSLHIRV